MEAVLGTHEPTIAPGLDVVAPETAALPAKKPIPRWRVVLGYGIVYLSLFCFALLMVIPIFPLAPSTRAALWTGVLITAEGGFWIGVFIAGPDLLARVRGWMEPLKRMFRRTPA
jgi:hypothetical protein